MVQIKQEIKERALITVEYVILFAVGLLVTFAILPTVLNTFNASTTTGWDSTTRTIWGIIPLVIIAVILVKVYKGGK